MKKTVLIAGLISLIGLLTGCAPTHLDAPCKNFGRDCSKVPVNSWDTSRGNHRDDHER